MFTPLQNQATLLDHVSDAIITTDFDFRINGWNRAAEEIYGWTADEVLGQLAYDVLKPIYPDQTRDKIIDYLMAHGQWSGEAIRQKKDGSRVYVHASVRLLEEPTGQLCGTVTIDRDMTERKQAEIALREREEKYRLLFENLASAALIFKMVCDAQSQIVDWVFEDLNVSAVEVVGRSKAEWIGQRLGDLLASEDAQRLLVISRQVMVSGLRQQFEFSFPSLKRAFLVVAFRLDDTHLVLSGNDITDRRQAEANLMQAQLEAKQEQERLRTILDALPVGVFIADACGCVVETNANARRIWGGTSALENMDDCASYKGWWPDTGQPVQPQEWALMRALTKGEICAGDVVNIERFDGVPATILAHAAPLRDREGQITGAVVAITDITEHTRTQRELRAANTRLQRFVDTRVIGVLVADMAGRILEANDYFLDMLGYSRSEFEAGRINWNNSTPFEHRAADQRAMTELTERGVCDPYEKEYYRKDGTRVWVLLMDVLLPDEKDKILALALNISDRKQAEQARRESEERFRQLADSMPQLVWTAKPDGAVDYYNQRREEFSGIASDDEGIYEWSPVLHPDDQQATIEAWAHSVETGDIYQIEHRVYRADGSLRWYLSRGIPVRDARGRILRWYGTATDIHDHKLAAQDLARAKEEVSTILSSISDGLMVLDENWQITYFNPAAEQILNLPGEQALGRNLFDIFPAARGSIFERKYAEAFRERQFLSFEGRYTVPPFENWYHVRVYPQKHGLSIYFQVITGRKRAEAAEREQRLLAEALRDVANALNSTLELPEVLKRILINLGPVVPHKAAAITLIEDHMARIVDCRGYGEHEKLLLMSLRLPVSETPHFRQMVNTRLPIIIPNLTADPYGVPILKNWNSYLGVPIVSLGAVIGFIGLFSDELNYFGQKHADRLLAFAEQAAIALKNAQAYQQAQELAAFQERERLSRELHDAVSQQLFSARVIAEALPRLWARSPEKVLARLQQLHQVTCGAQAEMRTLLLELRPAHLADAPLAALITQLVAAAQGRKNIRIETEIDETISLPNNLKIAFYRITQEALNNIVKHSRATQATLVLRRNGGGIALILTDNGSGFESGDVEATSLGLKIMQERAEAVGAGLTIHSQLGEGTQIQVDWPVEDK